MGRPIAAVGRAAKRLNTPRSGFTGDAMRVPEIGSAVVSTHGM
jgi:hypothetical protein